MSIFIRCCLLFFFCLGLTFNSAAKKIFNVEISIPESIKPGSLQIGYDNGMEKYKPVQVKVENGVISLSGEYYTEYATIMLHYAENLDSEIYYTSFWVSDKCAEIKISGIDTTCYSTLKYSYLKHAISLKDKGEEEMAKYIAKEKKDFDKLFEANAGNKIKDESIANLLLESHKKLTYKKIEFIKEHADLYPDYSIWLFRKDIARSYSVPSDTIISLYKTIFSENLRKTEEGKLVEDAIKTKPLKINSIAPNFVTKDVANNFIIRSNFKSEYTLIAFWASWCKPCVAEIPHIKDLRNKFSSDKLSIISVTRDDNYLAFLKAVRKYDMPWTHIFGDEELIRMFDVTAIPQIYLINKNGSVRYKISGYDPLDSDFIKIAEILKKDSKPTPVIPTPTLAKTANVLPAVNEGNTDVIDNR